ncbi:hypothetical protein HYH02_001640 [Chlamydomonas schloesseri]|uniref:Uncharacterized protein n=1 Tax=Chlamydomonas schloesseri TaxID=2026947 RepID=A0A835WT05_9CHLO|nr:hypothetical protein HYH02_001640 [Chlamydomonas schloesseri]|eukprot:KAG2453417.1 hypothetical protein HYH02_001640 [Chlamydomonas schloesseri]
MLRRGASLLRRVGNTAALSGQAGEVLPKAGCALAQLRGEASSAGGAGPSAAAQAAAASAAAAASGSGSAETPVSFFARQSQILATMPVYPKLLGFAGAIPFLTLTPQLLTAAGMPELIDYCARMQQVYGGSIVTFLGAVHWGLAMQSQTIAAPGTKKAQGALNERYVWSVVPSLAAVPALLLEPAQGSLAISCLLAICYLSDSSYFKHGYLPAWYMSLRGYLTVLAMLSMLSTTTYYLKRDLDRARQRMEEEDAKRAARMEARAASGGGLAAAAGASGAVAAAAGLSGKK